MKEERTLRSLRRRSLAVGPLRGYGLWLSVLVVVTYLVIALQQATQPYTIDEATFPYGAEGILKHGAPYFYNGETRPMDLGLWHPPLYIYSLAVHMMAFGSSHVSVRLFGILAVLVAFVVGLLTLRKIAPEACQAVYVAFAALLLLNPLVLSSALVPDIDGTVGICAVMLLLWLAMRLIAETPSRNLLVATIAVWALTVSAKFTLALLFIPLLLAAALLSRSTRITKVGIVVAGIITGSTVFVAGWFALSRLAGFPARAPVDYFISGMQRTSSSSGALRSVMVHLQPSTGVLFWIGPGLLAIALVSSVLSLAGRLPFVRKSSLAFLFVTGVYLIVAYAAITGSPFGFPKYWIAAIPALALVGSLPVEQVWRAFGPLVKTANDRVGPWILLLTGSLVFLAPLSIAYVYLSNTMRTGVRDLAGLTYVTAGAWLAYFLVLSAFCWLRVRLPLFRVLSVVGAVAIAALFFGVVSSQLALDLANRSADYSTRYYFGERGLGDTIAYLQREMPRDAYLFAAKDIGLQSGRRFFEDAAFFYQSPEALEAFLRDGPIRFLVTREKWDYSEPVFPQHFAVIGKYFAPVPNQPSPDFTVWKRKE